jgi:hypothetical protein
MGVIPKRLDGWLLALTFLRLLLSKLLLPRASRPHRSLLAAALPLRLHGFRQMVFAVLCVAAVFHIQKKIWHCKAACGSKFPWGDNKET